MPRLQDTIEAMARRRQRDFETQTKWSNQTEYYKSWDRRNSRYSNWTSPEYYDSALEQFRTERDKKEHGEKLEIRRERLRKMLFDEEQEYLKEMTGRPRRTGKKREEMETSVLKEVNLGLKLAEDDRRRHEAELKLYHKWRNENPVLQDQAARMNMAGVKVAWLDQQIEKRMEKEKVEEEMRKMIAQREKLIREDEQNERKDLEERAKKEKELFEVIETQVKALKLRESESDLLKREETMTQRKQSKLDDLISARAEDTKRRERTAMETYNAKETKLRLRKKATEIEDSLQFERDLIEQALKEELAEEISDENKREQTKHAMRSFLEYVRDQQHLERQRQKYISFVFDSEAKAMWDKQEKMWNDEAETRSKLLEDVLRGLGQQIQEKLDRNLEKQRELLKIREAQLSEIESYEQELQEDKIRLQQRKENRRLELEQQIYDKQLVERERQIEEEKKEQEELENIRREEEKVKNELILMQRQKYHPARFNRRILW